MTPRHTLIKGFTLVEMAVVLVIVGLMLGGLLVPLSAQMEQKNREETRIILDEAKEALIGFAMAKKYLPCPDANAIPDGTEGARNAGNQCVNPEGTLPWQALGVRGIDAWGRYIHYRVTPVFTDNSSFFSLASTGGVTVKSDTGTLTATAAAVLLSYGPNGYGGINTIHATPDNQMPSPTGTDEIENTNQNTTFVIHAPVPQGSANEFDDSLVWLPANILFNRMVAAGRLP